MNLELKLKIENIGPLIDIDFSHPMNSLNVGIYADNGSGKTFLSRTFDVISNYQQGKNINNVDSLINFDSTKASFNFDFSDSNNTNQFSLSADKENAPSIQVNSDLILHVFNKDFVEQNLEEQKYIIADKIEGKILISSDTIDISKEEGELTTYKTNKTNLEAEIETAITDKITFLDQLKINKNINEYKDVTYEYLLQISKTEDNDLNTSVENLKKINSFPENTEAINLLGWDFSNDSAALSELPNILSEEVSVSKVSEDFINKIKEKNQFIKDGLGFIKNNTCPFCEKPLENAISLINEYKEYFENAEAKYRDKLDNQRISILYLKDTLIPKLKCEYNGVALKFNNQKVYFNDLKDLTLPEFPNETTVMVAVGQLLQSIKDKSDNLSKVDFDIVVSLQEIHAYIKSLLEVKDQTNKLVAEIEEKKDKIADEILNAKKNVCKAALNDLFQKQQENILNLKDINKKIINKTHEIEVKKTASEKNRNTEVFNDFKDLLKLFFNTKYTYDDTISALKLNEKFAVTEADSVLSEGEKNIIGFCYYLALVHSKIKQDSDYKKLFFIIDDPISSLDFHYVFQVAQIIRDLKKRFNLEHSRFIILTHNIEFMNLLMKNKITKKHFALERNNLSKIDEKMIVPYMSHLKEICMIAKGEQDPTYSTANSIRHILETIGNFKTPKSDLEVFIKDESILSGCEYIYSIIQDFSHGRIRSQMAYTPEMIKIGCKTVLKYIYENYKGQLDELSITEEDLND